VYGQGSTGVQGFSSTGLAVWGIATGSATGVQGNAVSGVPLVGTATPASTNTVVTTLQLERDTSGTAANGIGQQILFRNRTTGFLPEIANRIISKWTNATSATRTSQYILTGLNSAVEADLHTVEGSGQHKFNKYGIGTFTGVTTHNLGVTSTGDVVENPVAYLSAIDSNDQTAASATATPMRFGTTSFNQNITIAGVNNTDITFTKTGIYNIQFSVQFIRTSGGTGSMSIWLEKNAGLGYNPVPDSNTDYQTSGNNDPFVITLNFLENVTQNDVYRVMWSSSDGLVQLEHKPAQVSPTRPATPSIILTVWKVA
jgi:hypothetical protein